MINFVQPNGAFSVSQGPGFSQSLNTNPWVVTPNLYGQSAFGEIRTSAPLALLNLNNRFGIDTRTVSTSASANAQVIADTTQSSVLVRVSASSGAIAELSTRTYFRYQAGRGQRWLMSAINSDGGSSGQNRSWGYFDDNNGLFYRLSGTVMGVMVRSNTSGVPVDTFVSQTNWNIDKFDGAGPSGKVLDVTKGSIYECDFEWLGVGNVFWFINGYPVHQQENGGANTAPYMATANLPIRVRVHNTASSAAGSVRIMCANVSSENGAEQNYWSFGAESAGYTTSGSTEVPLISLMLTGTFNGVDCRARLRPLQMSIINVAAANNAATIRVRSNMTINGASWNSLDSSSAAVVDTSSQNASGGTLLFGGIYVPGASALTTLDLTPFFPNGGEGIRRLVRDPYTGASDTITVTVERTTGANPALTASIAWGEEL